MYFQIIQFYPNDILGENTQFYLHIVLMLIDRLNYRRYRFDKNRASHRTTIERKQIDLSILNSVFLRKIDKLLRSMNLLDRLRLIVRIDE